MIKACVRTVRCIDGTVSGNGEYARNSHGVWILRNIIIPEKEGAVLRK